MHDGQNLFDPELSFAGVDWGVDAAVTNLMQHEALPGVIVVGIWNSPERLREYMPARMLFAPQHRALLSQFIRDHGGPPLSQQYLAFLVNELKPLIDATYRTLPDRAHTFVMGSSMGGLISLDAVVEYPHIFGGAGCLSTHWPIGQHQLVEYFGTVLPKPGLHRLYFDYGTEALDSIYEPFQQHMDYLLLRNGYTPEETWMTRRFEGAEHNEGAWRERVHIPLRFLLKGAQRTS
jgi:predicted alpha/beta superfamily hydrolase